MDGGTTVTGMQGLITAFQTATGDVQTNVSSFIAAAFPVGLSIMGTMLAIRLGIRFFKSVAN